MKKIKKKIITENKYNKFFNDNNIRLNSFNNKYMITESSLPNNSLYQTNKFSKTSINFNNIINNNESKYICYRKTLFKGDTMKLDSQQKIKLKLKIIKNNSNKDSEINRYILPYVNAISLDNKKKNITSSNTNQNKDKIKADNIYTNYTLANESFNKNLRNKYKKIMKYNKSENKENAFDIHGTKFINTEKYIFNKRNYINEQKSFKYSLILKNLDSWDKDHCEDNLQKSDINLQKFLYQYYKENNLVEDQKNLNFVSNILNSRKSYNNEIEEGRQNNKIFLDILKRKRIETGTILKNNLYRAQLKFSELFNKKYSKEFKDNLNIDSDILNLLIEDELKSVYYNKVIKERIKYEKSLHDELIQVNKIIIEKKNIKEDKIIKLKDLFVEKVKLNKEYNEKYNKNRKTYWNKYDNYEQYYKGLITSSNIKADNDIKNKIEETLDDMMSKNLIKKNTIVINTNEQLRRLSPNKKFIRKISSYEVKIKEDLKKQIKDIEFEKNSKLLNMNNEMNSKLKEMQDKYINKIDKITEEEKKLENQIKIIKLELIYYKKINNELTREHKLYYMNKLKLGYDTRKDGLVWIVENLFELQVSLEYHHFPKYLTHEQINYLKKYANLQLKQKELKIIIDVLKKKQNTQKMKDLLKCMDVIDNIIEVDGKIDENFENLEEYNNKELIAAKNNINKKFIRLYKDNIDIMKNYFMKNIENNEFYHVIKELKKDLYHGSNLDINKSKRDILNVFMGDHKNKNFFEFLLSVKSHYQLIEEQKEELFENQKQIYLKLTESNKYNKASINNVVKYELIKRCLFGTRLDN